MNTAKDIVIKADVDQKRFKGFTINLNVGREDIKLLTAKLPC